MDDLLYRRSRSLLVLAAIPLLAQAFVPTDQFVLRADDAFYYFQVAVNHVKYGFWTFDGLNRTNGVQPLWAILLTGLAHLVAWFGTTDKFVLARVFVALCVLLHYASALVLLHVLARRTTAGMAIAAAGGLIFPLNMMWLHAWGMENSLYALTLVGTVAYFELVHRAQPTRRSAAILGGLIGLTILARLNAVLFAIVFGVYYLCRAGQPSRLIDRAKLVSVTAAVSALLVLPYVGSNLATTGHLLPISGAAKTVENRLLLDKAGTDTRASIAFLREMVHRGQYPMRWFFTMHTLNGAWILGSRAILGETGAVDPLPFVGVLVILILLPLVRGRPREWFEFLRTRLALLKPFSYVAAFAALNLVISVIAYPNQVRYAMVSWWLVEAEITITVISATVCVAWAAYLTRPVVPQRRLASIVPLVLAGLTLVQSQRVVGQWFRGAAVRYDWNLSWNDQMYRGAQWLSANVPEDAILGSWNSGVIAYYSKQRLINLDGLINNFDYLPYLASGRQADYIKERHIRYLVDLDEEFTQSGVASTLNLTEVYRSWVGSMNQYYRVYRID